MAAIDLSDVPVVDNHCHNVYLRGPADAGEWRARFTESYDAEIRRDHVAGTLSYRRMVRELAVHADCEPDEETVLAIRLAREPRELVGDLWRAARFDALLLDRGLPPPDQALPLSELASLGGCRTFSILRVELLMQDLIAEHGTLAAVIEALHAALGDVRGGGYVGLKSIVAYRSGLDIRTWSADEVDASFRQARSEAIRDGAVRLTHKPLLDTLLHEVFKEAARQEVPMQLHVGYGDTDADMLKANPLHLRAVFEQPAYRAMPIVLLHECYPYTREGAYLAAVYGNAYLDLSYGIPFVGSGEMASFTRAAFGTAPTSKLLYSSDGVGLPEFHWLSARQGRRIVGEVLGEIVAQGDLSLREAEAAGASMLRRNALRLYGIGPGD